MMNCLRIIKTMMIMLANKITYATIAVVVIAAVESVVAEIHETTVTIEFEPLDDGRTLVTIAEEGWRDTEAAQHASYGNCEGWTGMLCAMKVWLEHRINLRDGFYK